MDGDYEAGTNPGSPGGPRLPPELSESPTLPQPSRNAFGPDRPASSFQPMDHPHYIPSPNATQGHVSGPHTAFATQVRAIIVKVSQRATNVAGEGRGPCTKSRL